MKCPKALAFSITLMVSCFSASADELQTNIPDQPPVVYESLDDIQVGTLFFSPAERRRLDALRAGIAISETKKAKSKSGSRDSSAAAGFIVSSSGKSRVFRKGDFRQEQPNPEMHFPGDVKVTRSSEDVNDDG